MDIDTPLNGYGTQENLLKSASGLLTEPRHPHSSHAPSDSARDTNDTNYAASLSNAETAMSSLPAKPILPTEALDQAPPVQAPPDTIDTIDGPHPEQGVLSLPSEPVARVPSPVAYSAIPLETNGSAPYDMSDSANITSVTDLIHPPVTEPSAPIHSEAAEPESQPVTIPLPATYDQPQMSETVAEIIPSLSQPQLGVNSLLNQPPTSDVHHSSPMHDSTGNQDTAMGQNLTSHDVILEDNTPIAQNESVPFESKMDSQPLQPPSDAMDISEPTPPVTQEKLPSPPPAPQPAPAELPTEVSTQPSEPPTVPMSEEVPAPAPTPAEPATMPTTSDTLMLDVAPPSTKVAREREEDSAEEPAAKRARTEEASELVDFKVPEVPNAADTPDATGEGASGVVDEDDTVTASRLAHMKKVISNLKKSNASAFFRQPVDVEALKIPTYFDIIKTPMDLGTIDSKLKAGKYNNVSSFIHDFELIMNNSRTFNGAEHNVTQTAVKMESSFNSQMANLPKASVAEPTREEKRAQKLKIEPSRVPPPRRPSVSGNVAPPGSARSPAASSPAQTYALGPGGIPLIRRDSTIQGDGRPKRAIIPTKRTDDLSGTRPRKKKYEYELRFCDEVMKELTANKNWAANQFFLAPVDPVALNIPTYFQIIRKPMDLSTVKQKLVSNQYEKAKDFEEDVRLIFKNCFKFNPDNDLVNQAGHRLEDLFENKWAQKEGWIKDNEPTSEPQSDDDEDDDEDADGDAEAEDDDEESDDERAVKIRELQKQIEAMSKQMGDLVQPPKKKKKSKSPPVKKSKSSKSTKEKSSTNFPNLKKKNKDNKDKKHSKPKAEKEKYYPISLAEKQYISNGISQLPDKQMTEALKIIQQNVPSLKNTHETEIELDIDEVPNHVLHKLLTFVKKYAGPPPEAVREEPAEYAQTAPHGGVGRPKKGKVSSREAADAHLEQLKGKLSGMQQNAASGRGSGSPSDNGMF